MQKGDILIIDICRRSKTENRNIPKLGRCLGKMEDLLFSSLPVLPEDGVMAPSPSRRCRQGAETSLSPTIPARMSPM